MNTISIVTNISTLVLFSTTLLVIGVCLFLIGYLAGKQTNYGVSIGKEKEVKGFFKEQNEPSKLIEMDSAKYVVNIKTDGIEKKYESLGEIKESQENISESINKLKNLKR